MKCKINRLIPDGNGHFLLELSIKEDIRSKVDELLGKDLECEIKPVRGKKRSLDANAFFWKMLDTLAEKLRIPKVELYKEYIRNIGGNSETVCVQDKAVEKLCRCWEQKGIGWQTERMPSKIEGCTNVILYYGSSEYDTKQMSRLIDLLVADCKEQGIETSTPDEISKLISLWEPR